MHHHTTLVKSKTAESYSNGDHDDDRVQLKKLSQQNSKQMMNVSKSNNAKTLMQLNNDDERMNQSSEVDSSTKQIAINDQMIDCCTTNVDEINNLPGINAIVRTGLSKKKLCIDTGTNTNSVHTREIGLQTDRVDIGIGHGIDIEKLCDILSGSVYKMLEFDLIEDVLDENKNRHRIQDSPPLEQTKNFAEDNNYLITDTM